MNLHVLLFGVLVTLTAECIGGKSEEKCKEYLQSIKDKHEIIPSTNGPNKGLGKVSTAEGEFPHMAILGYGPSNDIQWNCGGSLISDQYILTSAICTYSKQLGPVTAVRLGTTSREDTTTPILKVAEVIVHPEFKLPARYNDIGLVKLEKKVNFGKNLRPACLYTSDDVTALKDLSATGWGKTALEGGPSSTLLKVYLDLFTNEECQQSYKSTSKRLLPLNILDKSQICAGGREASKDTCQGDSGGPLQVLDSDKMTYHIVGTISFGKSCGIVGLPAVYTRVSNYVPWIESIVWQ